MAPVLLLAYVWISLASAAGLQECSSNDQDSHCTTIAYSTYDETGISIIDSSEPSPHPITITCYAQHVCSSHPVHIVWHVKINNSVEQTYSLSNSTTLNSEFGMTLTSTCPDYECTSTLVLPCLDKLNNTHVSCGAYTDVCPHRVTCNSSAVTLVTTPYQPAPLSQQAQPPPSPSVTPPSASHSPVLSLTYMQVYTLELVLFFLLLLVLIILLLGYDRKVLTRSICRAWSRVKRTLHNFSSTVVLFLYATRTKLVQLCAAVVRLCTAFVGVLLGTWRSLRLSISESLQSVWTRLHFRTIRKQTESQTHEQTSEANTSAQDDAFIRRRVVTKSYKTGDGHIAAEELEEQLHMHSPIRPGRAGQLEKDNVGSGLRPRTRAAEKLQTSHEEMATRSKVTRKNKEVQVEHKEVRVERKQQQQINQRYSRTRQT